MKNLFILKGGSAAGKGTRVSQLIEFLKSEGNNCETVSYPHNGKKIAVGKFFPAYGLFIPGKYSVSNKSGLTSWSGMDHLHSTFKTAEKAREVVSSLVNELNAQHVILEGEPMFLSDKYRPQFLDAYYQPDQIHILYYLYQENERNLYDERIIGRSGKKSGDSGWSRIQSYLKEVETSKAEAVEVNKLEPRVTIKEFSVLEDPSNFVCYAVKNIFESIGVEYKGMHQTVINTWCAENSMMRKLGEADPLKQTTSLW